MTRKPSLLEGPAIVGIATLLVAAEVAIVLATRGTELDGVRAGIRVTARSSLILLCAAFAASSLVALWPGRATKWLLRNRRYVGLSFAVSHAAHAALIAAYAAGWSDRFLARGIAGDIPAAVGYLFVLGLTLTSTDGARDRLGARRWKLLHTTGMYVLWGIFAFVYAGATVRDPAYAPAFVLVVAALAVRIAAWRRARSRRLKAH